MTLPEFEAPPGRRPFTALRTKAEFDRAFDEGKRHRLGPLSLILRRGDSGYRLGLKVGRRVGNAVVRNLLRRRVKSILGELIPAGSGADLVVIAHPGASRLTFGELQHRLGRCLRKSGFVERRTSGGMRPGDCDRS